MQFSKIDIDNLVNYVNMVTQRAKFRLNSDEALRLAQLIVGLKDLKDKLERAVAVSVTPQTTQTPPQQQQQLHQQQQQGAQDGMVRRRS